EQAASIDEVSGAMRQLDEMTQHNAALVEETNAAIEQTEAQAREVDAVVETFRLQALAEAQDTSDKHQPPGIKGLQQRVARAARGYLTRGNTATAEDWSGF